MTQAESFHLPHALRTPSGFGARAVVPLPSFQQRLRGEGGALVRPGLALERPRDPETPGPPRCASPCAGKAADPGARSRILMVDDDRVLLGHLQRLLQTERPQWSVLTAFDGVEAIRLLRAEPLDLLVSDIQMPGMDGMALLAEVRREPALARLPVIFITARDDRASVRSGMASGADDYLTKPFSPEELIQAMDARLRRVARDDGQAVAGRGLFDELAAILTGRELEVLALIGQGLVTKDIAADLDLSFRTVSVHRANIMRKLDLHNAAALAALAIQANIA